MVEIAVIGGGIAGCSTALILSNFFGKIDIFEQEEKILTQTFSRCWARIHTGLHYPLKKERGILAAKSSIVTAPFYADFLLDSKRPQYFCTKKTEEQLSFPTGELLTCDDYLDYAKWLNSFIINDEIKTKYFQGLELLGTSLWHKISPDDAIYPSSAGIGLETNERVIELDKLIKNFRLKIRNNPNINLYTNTEITSVKAEKNGKYLLVLSNNTPQKYDYVINASRWSTTGKLEDNSHQFLKLFKQDYSELRFYVIAENISQNLNPTHQYIHSKKAISYAYINQSNLAIIEALPKSILEISNKRNYFDRWFKNIVNIKNNKRYLQLADEILFAAQREYPALKTANIHKKNSHFIMPMIQPSIREHKYMEKIFFETPGEKGQIDYDGYFYVRGAKITDSILYAFYILQQIVIDQNISSLKNLALSKTPAEFMSKLIQDSPNSFTLKN